MGPSYHYAIAYAIGLCYYSLMEKEITRADARKMLNCQTNYKLAQALGCTHQYVYQWDDDRPIPPPMQGRVKALAAEGETNNQKET